jgi:hypothetical protein
VPLLMSEQEIEAVRFILRCFTRASDEQVDRNELINEKAASDEYVKKYARLTRQGLVDHYLALMARNTGETMLSIIGDSVLICALFSRHESVELASSHLPIYKNLVRTE